MRHFRIAVPILALGIAASIALTARAVPVTVDARDPIPLRGTALDSDTGLRLLVPDNPPFVLDVDSGTAIPSSVPALSRGTLRILGVGGRAAVVVGSSVRKRADLYGVRGRDARVSKLGTGAHVWPAADGRSVWVQSVVSDSRCTLRRMGLEGRQLRAPRPFPCAVDSDPAAGWLGLVSRRTRVLDPQTGRLVLRTRWGVHAVAGTTLVLAGPATGVVTSSHQFTLLDATTRSERRFRWPSILLYHDAPAVDPRGRFVALAFADPTTSFGGQVLDVWLVDTLTGKLTQLPGMPALVSLKRTSMAWTDDGRLVLLSGRNGRYVVAVWRLGQRRLALKTVQLAELDAGSHSFAILR
ncbi:MAG: hypothetical protein H0V43_00830 [Gemmatimonadales bacterium]|nr:hypothetical protein [Gemmatimonadales bacterium]